MPHVLRPENLTLVLTTGEEISVKTLTGRNLLV
jgi:hypothetical protein